MSGIERIAACRAEQIERFGHTPEADLNLPLKLLPDRGIRKLTRAQEDIHFRQPGWKRLAVQHLAQAGALIAAAIDRIEAEATEPETSTTTTGEPL